MRRAYSKREKADALALLSANAGNVRRTARESGLPHMTVDGWAKGRGITEEVQKMSETPEVTLSLADKFKSLSRACLNGITPEKIEKASVRDLAVASGIFAEKGELLSGNPTKIIENRMREHYIAVARRTHARRTAAGEQVTLEEVVREIVGKYPHTGPYLLHAVDGVMWRWASPTRS